MQFSKTVKFLTDIGPASWTCDCCDATSYRFLASINSIIILLLSYQRHIEYYYCSEVFNRHAQAWDMFVTVVKGFVNRGKVRCPICARRTVDMKTTT